MYPDFYARWLQERLAYCAPENRLTNNWCHVGGFSQPQESYGYPHVTGFVHGKHVTNCIYCGKEVLKKSLDGEYIPE
jgi:hypothetical protein